MWYKYVYIYIILYYNVLYYMVSCISSSLSASLGGRPKVPKYARVTSQENQRFGDVSVAKSIVYASPCDGVEFKFFMCPLEKGFQSQYCPWFSNSSPFLVKLASRLLQKNNCQIHLHSAAKSAQRDLSCFRDACFIVNTGDVWMGVFCKFLYIHEYVYNCVCE